MVGSRACGQTLLFTLLSAEVREEIARARKKLVARLQEQLWSAACLRDYQLSCVQRAFDAEVEQIEREFEAEKGQLKDRLLADLMEHRRRLLEKRELTTDDANGTDSCPANHLRLATAPYAIEISPMAVPAAVAASGNAPSGRGGYQRKLRGKRAEAGESRVPPGGKRRQLQMGVEDMASAAWG